MRLLTEERSLLSIKDILFLLEEHLNPAAEAQSDSAVSNRHRDNRARSLNRLLWTAELVLRCVLLTGL